MDKKIKLNKLKVKSFITKVNDSSKVKGGTMSTMNIMASVCVNYCPLK